MTRAGTPPVDVVDAMRPAPDVPTPRATGGASTGWTIPGQPGSGRSCRVPTSRAGAFGRAVEMAARVGGGRGWQRGGGAGGPPATERAPGRDPAVSAVANPEAWLSAALADLERI